MTLNVSYTIGPLPERDYTRHQPLVPKRNAIRAFLLQKEKGETLKTLAKTLAHPVAFLLLPVLLLMLMGASCTRINPTNHSPNAKPLFDVYFSGAQSTNWVENDNSNCWITTGAGTEQLTFGMPKPLRLDASAEPTYPPPQFDIKELVTRDGKVSVSDDPKCSPTDVGGGGGDGTTPIGPDCGTLTSTQSGSFGNEGAGKFYVTVESLGGIDDYSNCPKILNSPFFTGLSTDGTDYGLKIVLPKGDLTDGTKLALTKSGSDTYTYKGTSDLLGTVSVDWTLTFCRVTSNLNFTDAVNAAKRELEKSPTYRQFASQHPNLPITEQTLPKGTIAEDLLSRSTHEEVIHVDWNKVSNGFELIGVLGHEMGHSNNFTTEGYTPTEAAPFLPDTKEGVAEYEALVWQEELDANLFALKVLREVEQADHAISPCVEGFMRSGANPYVTDLARGDINAAKTVIKTLYNTGQQDFQQDRGSTKYPDVQTKLQSIDLTQLVNAWK